MGSYKYDLGKKFKLAKELLKDHPAIVRESLLYPCMAVSKDWFYGTFMKSKTKIDGQEIEYSDLIKKEIENNRAQGARLMVQKMMAHESPACIIAAAKILNDDIKEALTDKFNEDVKPTNVTVVIGDDKDKDVTVTEESE